MEFLLQVSDNGAVADRVVPCPAAEQTGQGIASVQLGVERLQAGTAFQNVLFQDLGIFLGQTAPEEAFQLGGRRTMDLRHG